MRIIREVNDQAERFYPTAEKLGKLAATMLRKDHRSQMTSLENIAETTLKSSDVYDYIKKQMARPNFDGWRRIPSSPPSPPRQQPVPSQAGAVPIQNQPANKSFGQSLLDELNGLKDRSGDICSQLGFGTETDEDKYERQQVFLKLIRQLIRQVVVQYEFSTSMESTQYLKSQQERKQHGPNRGTTS